MQKLICQLRQPCSLSYLFTPSRRLLSCRLTPPPSGVHLFLSASMFSQEMPASVTERALITAVIWPLSLIAVSRAMQNQHFPILRVESVTDTSHLLCLHTVYAADSRHCWGERHLNNVSISYIWQGWFLTTNQQRNAVRTLQGVSGSARLNDNALCKLDSPSV